MTDRIETSQPPVISLSGGRVKESSFADTMPLVVRDLREAKTTKPFVDVIWNLTKVCVWDCGVCCVDADHVRRVGNVIEIRTQGLEKTVAIPYERGAGSIYQQALRHQQQLGFELTLEQKLKVLDQALRPGEHHVDGHRRRFP
jgi:hypothetical protein